MAINNLPCLVSTQVPFTETGEWGLFDAFKRDLGYSIAKHWGVQIGEQHYLFFKLTSRILTIQTRDYSQDGSQVP